MKHVPRVIKSLDSKQLVSIQKYMSDVKAVAYRKLIDSVIETISQTILSTKPEGSTLDYYGWGYRQGLLEAHELYRDLLKHVTDELSNREVVDSQNKVE